MGVRTQIYPARASAVKASSVVYLIYQTYIWSDCGIVPPIPYMYSGLRLTETVIVTLTLTSYSAILVIYRGPCPEVDCNCVIAIRATSYRIQVL